jgi:hypothetical protein
MSSWARYIPTQAPSSSTAPTGFEHRRGPASCGSCRVRNLDPERSAIRQSMPAPGDLIVGRPRGAIYRGLARCRDRTLSACARALSYGCELLA